MPTNRMFVETTGVDDAALSQAFNCLTDEAKKLHLDAVVIVPTKQQAESLGRVLGADAAIVLAKGQSVDRNGVRTNLALLSKPLPADLSKKVALAVWCDDASLNKIEEKRPASIVFVPWTSTDGGVWIRTWNPLNLLTMQRTPASSIVSNPVVVEALKTLTSIAHRSLAHPSDRDKAIEAFEALKKAREVFVPDEVRVWAVRNGWNPTQADELQKIAQGVKEGKRFRKAGGPMLKADMVERWRKQAERDTKT